MSVSYERAADELRTQLIARYQSRRSAGSAVTLADIVDVFEAWTETPIERLRGKLSCSVDAREREPALWPESAPPDEYLRVELARSYYGKHGASTISAAAIVDGSCASKVIPIDGFDGPRMFKNIRRVLGDLDGLGIEALTVEMFPSAESDADEDSDE